jgi:predicted dehydrogenase
MTAQQTAPENDRNTTRPTQLRVAFIGAGGIAAQHLRHYQQCSDVAVVAAADVKQENLDRWRSEHGVARTFTDHQQMLEQVKPDAVSVCTPNFLHCQPTLDALDAGAHVFVEKPLAMNAEEGQQMLRKAREKGLKLTIAFQWRFTAKTQAIRQAYDNGTLGDVMYARVHAMRRRGIPNWGVFGRKEMQGGGPMIDIGVHAMEMCHYAMGLPRPISATGRTWTFLGDKPSTTRSQWPNWDHESYNVEDLAVGQIHFDNGAVMSVESMFAGHAAPEDMGMRFELFGTEGAAHLEPLRFYFDKDDMMMNAEPDFLPKDNAWEQKMRNFVNTALYDTPDQSPAEHGLLIQKMVDAVYQSAQAQKEIAIDP